MCLSNSSFSNIRKRPRSPTGDTSSTTMAPALAMPSTSGRTLIESKVEVVHPQERQSSKTPPSALSAATAISQWIDCILKVIHMFLPGVTIAQSNSSTDTKSTGSKVWIRTSIFLLTVLSYQLQVEIRFIIHNCICLGTLMATRYYACRYRSTETLLQLKKFWTKLVRSQKEEDDCEDDSEGPLEKSNDQQPQEEEDYIESTKTTISKTIQEAAAEPLLAAPASFLPGANQEDDTDEWGHFTDFQDPDHGNGIPSEMMMLSPASPLRTKTISSAMSSCCSSSTSSTASASSLDSNSTCSGSSIGSGSNNAYASNGTCGMTSSLDDPFKSITKAILRRRGDVLSVCKMDQLIEEEEYDEDYEMEEDDVIVENNLCMIR